MTEFAAQLEGNIFDLSLFRAKKQEILEEIVVAPKPLGKSSLSTQELGTQVDNIKKSIQRINQLMAELRTISQPYEENF